MKLSYTLIGFQSPYKYWAIGFTTSGWKQIGDSCILITDDFGNLVLKEGWYR